jgi:hypothetical protein
LCAHLPLRVPDNMFDGLDDDVDDMPIDVGTPATAANPATAPEKPEWDSNTFDTNAVFDDLGITFRMKYQVFLAMMMNLILHRLLMKPLKRLKRTTIMMGIYMPEIFLL